MKQQIAIYLRLSLEDVDKRTNKVKDESNSIASQRLLNSKRLNDSLIDMPIMQRNCQSRQTVPAAKNLNVWLKR